MVAGRAGAGTTFLQVNKMTFHIKGRIQNIINFSERSIWGKIFLIWAKTVLISETYSFIQIETTLARFYLHVMRENDLDKNIRDVIQVLTTNALRVKNTGVQFKNVLRERCLSKSMGLYVARFSPNLELKEKGTTAIFSMINGESDAYKNLYTRFFIASELLWTSLSHCTQNETWHEILDSVSCYPLDIDVDLGTLKMTLLMVINETKQVLQSFSVEIASIEEILRCQDPEEAFKMVLNRKRRFIFASFYVFVVECQKENGGMGLKKCFEQFTKNPKKLV